MIIAAIYFGIAAILSVIMAIVLTRVDGVDWRDRYWWLSVALSGLLWPVWVFCLAREKIEEFIYSRKD